MEKIRVVMAIEPPVLCEMLMDWFQGEPDLQIVGSSQHPLDTMLAVRRTEADVVVTVTDTDEMPCFCTHLFDEFPELMVIAISADARKARLYRQQVSETRIGMQASHDLLASMRRLLVNEN